MKIGYIGLGALGSELARRFLKSHELRVWDMNTDASARLGNDGALVMASAKDVAVHSDVILLCLPRSSDVRQVLFDQGGVAEGLSPGKLVIDQTSGVAKETHEMARLLAERGVDLMDAAVSAGPSFVAQGGATLMASAPDHVYERALPVLLEITQTIFRCGTAVGDGQAMKTINNAMNGGCRVGTLEVAVMGRKAGLALQAMTEALSRSGGRSVTTDRMLPAIAEGKASTNFGLSLMLKDIHQAVALGMDACAPMPLTGTARALFQIGANTLGAGAQLEDMIGLVERMAATTFMPSNPAHGAFPAPIQGHDDRRPVGLVGGGRLGRSIARRLLATHRLHVHAVPTELRDELVQAGAVYAPDLQTLARECQVILLCVNASTDVRDVLLAPNGLAQCLGPGAVVLDHCGGDPRQTRQLASELAAMGVTLLDVPALDELQSADDGPVGMLLGGPVDACGRVWPLLTALDPNIVYCGTSGQAHMAKIVNDAVSAICLLMTFECVAVGLRYGLKLQDMAMVLDRTSGWSAVSRKILPALAHGSFSSEVRLQDVASTLRIAADISLEIGAPMTIANAARGVLDMAVHVLGEGATLGALTTMVESTTSTRFESA